MGIDLEHTKAAGVEAVAGERGRPPRMDGVVEVAPVLAERRRRSRRVAQIQSGREKRSLSPWSPVLLGGLVGEERCGHEGGMVWCLVVAGSYGGASLE